MPEDALIKREFLRLGDGRLVIIREEWDTYHPACPFAFIGSRPPTHIERRLVSIERFDLMYGKGAAAKLPMLH